MCTTKITAMKNLPAQYTRSVAGIRLGIKKLEAEFVAAGGRKGMTVEVSVRLVGDDFARDRVTFVMESRINK